MGDNMRVKCIQGFRGRERWSGVAQPGPHPVTDGIYTVTGDDGWGYELAGFRPGGFYKKIRFAPLTADDFTFEDIDEIVGLRPLMPTGGPA
jgi:hypothetical protein